MPRTLVRPRTPPGVLSGAWQTEVSHSTYPLEHGACLLPRPMSDLLWNTHFLILRIDAGRYCLMRLSEGSWLIVYK